MAFVFFVFLFMEKEYKVKSDRYNHTHKFVKTEFKYSDENGNIVKDDNVYIFVPEQDWMSIYVTYSDSNRNEVAFIDTEGGPDIYQGWKNDEITVVDMFIADDKMYFHIKEHNRTTTTVEQTRKLLHLGVQPPPEIKNWSFDLNPDNYVKYADDNKFVHILDNYNIGLLTSILIGLTHNKIEYNIKHLEDGKWELKFKGKKGTKFDSIVDLLVYAIEKIMEGK